MKKIDFVAILLVIVSFVTLSNNILAEEKEEKLYFEKVMELNEKYEIKRDSDFEALNEKKMNQYIEEIEILKEKYFPSNPPISLRGTYDQHSDAAGDILSTPDSKTSGFAHGHAGIHSLKGSETVEGVSPSNGILIVKNGMDYWRNKKGKAWRYEVKGATRTQNINAVKKAQSIAKNKKIYYCAVKLPTDTECYQCATMVAKAWSAGGKVTIKYPAYEGADGKTRYSNAKMPSHFRISHMLKKVKSY